MFGDLEVFESVGAVGAEDSFFVALAEDEDEVALLGFFESESNRFFAVELDDDLVVL